MAIDKSGEWWRGASFADLVTYLEELTADGYPVAEVRQSRCACGGTVFRVLADPDEGCAQRTCLRCGTAAFIGDSDESWGEAAPEPAICPCGAEAAEVGVGFAERPDGEVRWLTVGQRCTQCGVLGSWVDWKIDYAPTAQLRTEI